MLILRFFARLFQMALLSLKTSASAANFSVHLVVAHYNEDLSWLHSVTHISQNDTFVYQRHSPLKPRYLPNKGNECLPYVRHIVDYYDTLPDYMICVHGHPLKHCPNYLTYLNSAPIFATKADFEAGKPRELVFITDTYRNNSFNRLRNLPKFFEYYEKVLGKPIPAFGTSIWASAQFQVCKELIRRRPLTFWTGLLAELQSNATLGNGPYGVYVCGWLEQIWHQIFGMGEVTSVVSTAYVEGVQSPMCNRDPGARTS